MQVDEINENENQETLSGPEEMIPNEEFVPTKEEKPESR